MAKRVIELITDDYDGTELPAGGGETVTFSLDGRSYEIDLSRANAKELRAALAPYVKAGRKSSNGSREYRRIHLPRAGDNHRIRQWARRNGYTVSARGKIPDAVKAAFEAAG